MKKLLLSIVILTGIATMANAQLRIGVKGGLNLCDISNVYVSDISNVLSEIDGMENAEIPYDMTSGFHFGLTGEYMLSGTAGITADILYSQLGARAWEKGSFTDGEYEVTSTLNPSYLKVPVQAIYKFPVSDNLSMKVGGGLYAAYGLGGEIKTELIRTDSNGIETKEDFFGDHFRDFDWGMTLGAGIQYKRLILSASYEHGIQNILKGTDDVSEEGDESFVNKNFAISIGFLF